MVFDKVNLLTGRIIENQKISIPLNVEQLIQSGDLVVSEISSEKLNEKLAQIFKLKEDCIKNESIEDVAQYRATEWKLISDAFETNLDGDYRTSYLTNRTINYLVVKTADWKAENRKE